MPTVREKPYSEFKFLVSLGRGQGDGSEDNIIGGFSEVSGLGVDVEFAEYRDGNEESNTARKAPGAYKFDDITLKRGIVAADDLLEWVETVREGTTDPRSVTITLLDEARRAVASWVLRNAQPMKWTGPTLAAQGAGDVAVDELRLICDGVEYRP